MTELSTSQRGIDLIKQFEGLRLSAYQDAVGVWTIGYGHTGTTRAGQRITEAEAEALLRADVESFERAVNELVDVPINQNQFDALVSFSFNVGSGALSRSTLVRKLNAKNYPGAADELLRWNKAGGRVLRGLSRRRAAERALFLEPDDEPSSALADDPDQLEVDLPLLRPPYPTAASTMVLLDYLLIDEAAAFDPGKLEDTVRKFQEARGLGADGIVGPITWRALLDRGRAAA